MKHQNTLQYIENLFMEKSKPHLDKFSRAKEKVSKKLTNLKNMVTQKVKEVCSNTLSKKAMKLFENDRLIDTIGLRYPKGFYTIESNIENRKYHHIVAVKSQVELADFKLTQEEITALVLEEVNCYAVEVEKAICRIRRLI